MTTFEFTFQVLKLYAWEPSFEKKVLDIRNKELNVLKKMSYLNSFTTFTWTVAPYLVSVLVGLALSLDLFDFEALLKILS